jgi:hypothetical protein
MALTVDHINSISRTLGLSETQHRQLHTMLAPHVSRLPEVSAAAAAARAGLQPISPLKAAEDSRNLPLLREAAGHCRQLGYKLDLNSDKPVDLWELDRAFAAAAEKRSDRAIHERVRCKSALAQLRLI